MSKIVIAEPRTGQEVATDFSTLVEIAQGTAILSLADSDSFIEFGLSENLLLRIEAAADRPLQVTVVSTHNPDDIVPVRLQIIGATEEPSAALVEQRLHHLRQVYAIIFLLDAGREEELATFVRDNPSVDIEEKLLGAQERLFLQAAGPGSWWITALSRIKGSGQAALNILSLFYSEGRNMLIERVRLGTDLKKEEVVAKQIANDQARVQVAVDLALKLEKIKNPESREIIRQVLLSNSSAVSSMPVALLPPSEKS